MNAEVMEAIQTILDNKGATDLIVSGILDNGARSAMRDAIGDRTPRQHDKADKIAEGIQNGVRNTFEEIARAK